MESSDDPQDLQISRSTHHLVVEEERENTQRWVFMVEVEVEEEEEEEEEGGGSGEGGGGGGGGRAPTIETERTTTLMHISRQDLPT